MGRGNVQPRLERCADEVASDGIALAMMLADRRIDPVETVALALMARRLCGYSVQLEDIAIDYRLMDQTWRLGRDHAPNDPLAARMRDVEALLADLDWDLLQARAEDVLTSRTVDEALDWLLGPLLRKQLAPQISTICEAA